MLTFSRLQRALHTVFAADYCPVYIPWGFFPVPAAVQRIRRTASRAQFGQYPWIVRITLKGIMLLWWPVRVGVLGVSLTRRFGATVQERTGKGLWRQIGEQLQLTLGLFLSPRDYYRYDLYLDRQRLHAGEYLQNHERAGLAIQVEIVRITLKGIMLLWWPVRVGVLGVSLTRRFGATVQERTGKGLWRQIGEQLQLTLGLFLSPRDYYRYDLYLDRQRLHAGEYLQNHERAGLAWCLNAQPHSEAINDKIQFAQVCTQRGIASVPICAIADMDGIVSLTGRGEDADHNFFQSSDPFFKGLLRHEIPLFSPEDSYVPDIPQQTEFDQGVCVVAFVPLPRPNRCCLPRRLARKR